MIKENYAKHIIALSALFIMGNSVIFLPLKGADEYSFLGYIISILFSFLITFLFYIIFKLFYKEYKNVFLRILISLFLLIFAVFVMWNIGNGFLEFINSVYFLFSQNISKVITGIVFLILSFVLAFTKLKIIYKFSLIVYIITGIISVVLFVLMIPQYDFSYITVYEINDFKDLVNQSLPYIINVTLPCILLPLFFLYQNKNTDFRTLSYGVFVGVITLGICIFNSVLVLSPALAGRLLYPYLFSVSTYTAGSLFTRLDGFAFFIYFASSLVKTSFLLKCIWIIVKEIYKNLTFQHKIS